MQKNGHAINLMQFILREMKKKNVLYSTAKETRSHAEHSFCLHSIVYILIKPLLVYILCTCLENRIVYKTNMVLLNLESNYADYVST